MRLILVRHGDAYAGLHGPIAGPAGCRGLTDLGREQAAALRDHLAARRVSVDVLMASELPRAIETAAAVAPALGIDEVPQDCDLCEVHTGEADGTDWGDYTAKFGTLDMQAEPDRLFAPGGDSWNTFHARVDSLMHRLADQRRGQTVMAVSHAGVIAATIRLRFGDSAGVSNLRPTNTGLTEWDYEEGSGRWSLRYYNLAAHLG